ncbi:MAG: ABC-F family ATP-binding cassette domain-containing protein [Candidatus Latescibacterota bacterium]
MLTITSLTKSFGARTLFSNLSLTVNAGDRLAIVGPNGSGKTTLLEIITGNMDYDSGEMHFQRGAALGYLEQELPPDSEKELLQEVASARSSAERLAHKRDLLHHELAEATDPGAQALLLQELAEIESHYEHSGGYTVEYEAKVILTGLGFKERDFNRRLSEFSGGWLMRAGLARLLLSEPDVLLLDEPTNHLDIEAIMWFERYLQGYAGAVILVSHDRTFINRMANRVIAFEPDGPRLYRGNYDAYRIGREKEEEIIKATIKNQEKFIQSETRFIERFRAKNTKSAQVQSRIKRLEKMETVTALRTPPKVRFRIPESPRSGKIVIALEHASFSYDGAARGSDDFGSIPKPASAASSHDSAPLFRDLHFGLGRGDRVALVGPNGAGKTTLLKLLAGVLEPIAGERILGYNVTPSYYAQHQSEQLYEHNTVLDEMKRVALDESEESLRTMLGAFLFRGDEVRKKVAVLSGGEKARLALAKLLIRPANLILMDEPTNHLDIPSRDVLADALSTFDGTLVLVTHDRDLIDRTATKIIEIADGNANVFFGNFSDYLYRKEHSSDAPEKSASASAPAGETDEKADQNRRMLEKERKRLEGELRNRFYRETKRLQADIRAVESDMEKNDSRLRDIEKMLENPALCDDREQFNRTLNEYEAVKTKNAGLNEKWVELSLELEEKREEIFGKE